MKNQLTLIALILSIAFSGCTNSENHRVSKTLTLNLQEGDPPSLNPYLGVDLRSRCLYLSLFEPLMRRNSDGTLQLAAAESVEVNPEYSRYTFHIRPHVWSNGKPVTAKHFEQAWKFALDPQSPCIRPDLFYPIKNAKPVKKGELPLESLGITAIDDKTLTIELEHSTPYFLELVATSFLMPLYQASSEEPQYFNGPFILKDHQPDKQLTLSKNTNYWDRDTIEIDQLKFYMVKDPMTALALFEKGELDLVGDPFSTIPFDAVPSLKNSKQLESKVISRIFYLLINTESYPLNNKNLRKALSLSIDRDLFTQHLFFGQLPTHSLLPLPLSLVDSEVINELKNKDSLALFNQALEEMGLTRETFPTITLSYAELTGQKQMAEFVQERWKQVLGIDITLHCSEWNVHSADLRRKNYQIGGLHLTTLYQDPMFYFDLFRDKTSPTNYCLWESPEFNHYLTKQESTTDLVERSAYLKEAEKHLMEEMPAIPVFTQNFQYLKQKNVEISLTDLGIYDFKRARKIIEDNP